MLTGLVGRGAPSQSTRSTRSRPVSTSASPTAHETRNSNTIVLGSVQNLPRQSAVLAAGESHIHLDLWKEAIARLSNDDKAQIERAIGDVSIPVHEVVDNMIDLATKKQQEYQMKGWTKTVYLGDHEISLGDLASKTIIWLNKFKEIGNIVVQYDPVHAALPWAAVRFLLQAATVTEEQMAASFAIMERVTRVIHRCQIYEKLYYRKTEDLIVVKSLESALIKLYASVLQGLVETNKFLTLATYAKPFYAIFHPTTGPSLLGSIEEGEREVGREVNVCEARCRAQSDARFQDQLHSLLELMEPVLRIDKNVDEVLQRLEKEELIRILNWISRITYQWHHDTVMERRTQGTCDVSNCLRHFLIVFRIY